MKKRFLSAFAFVALTLLTVELISCTSPGRTSYNTLAAMYQVTDGAVQGYLSAVLHGQVKTNGVPRVLSAWDQFRTVWGMAVTVASSNTNALAPQYVINSSSNVNFTINSVIAP